MITTFEKELEGKGLDNWNVISNKITHYIPIEDILKAKNKVKKEIIEEINKLRITDDITVGRYNNNKALEQARKIIEDKL